MKFLNFSILFLLFGSVVATAQNTASPYSVLGIGEVEHSNFDRTSGLGHAGVALTSDRFLLTSNPASSAFLPNRFFHFEVAARFKSVNYSGTPIKSGTDNMSNDLQFKRVSFGIKPTKNWGMGFGLLPYSTANYSFAGTMPVQGSNDVLRTYNEGTGGINQIYWANSYMFKFGKKDSTSFLLDKRSTLSIGLQTSYMFGQINHKQSIYGSFADSVLTTEKNSFASNPFFKAGILYKMYVNPKIWASVGATANLATAIVTADKLTVIDGQTFLKNEEKLNTNFFTIPVSYTTGFAVSYKNKYTLTADYASQLYSQLTTNASNYTNAQRYSIGLQYSNNVEGRGGVFFEKNFLQAGFFYKKGNLVINNTQINDYGITLGGGMQIFKNIEAGKLAILGSIELGAKGTTKNNLIKENYTNFNITLSYRDFWYSNVKRYD